MPVEALTAELMGTFPSLPYLHSLQLINRAWTRVRDLRLWSWQLVADAEIFTPTAVCAGSVTAWYQHPTIRLDATATQAFQQICDQPPVSGQLGIGRQIRICAGGAMPDSLHPRWDQGVRWDDCPPAQWGAGPGTSPPVGVPMWNSGITWDQGSPPVYWDGLLPRQATAPQPTAPYYPIQSLCKGGPYPANFLQSGPNYTIVDWDGASEITLDKPYGEPSVYGAPYQCYKCYYSAPAYPTDAIPPALPGYDTSLIRFLSLTNKTSGYTIRGKKLWYTQDMLNSIDPQRGGTGDAFIIASYGRNPIGLPVFELYPNPVRQTTYYVTYWTRWPDVSATFDFPQVPYGLANSVMDLARVFACQWAHSNVATKPELQMTNWVNSASFYKTEFREGLIQCIKQDDEMSPLRPFRQSSKFDFPLGGEFLQGHDVSSLIGWP